MDFLKSIFRSTLEILQSPYNTPILFTKILKFNKIKYQSLIK